MRFLEDHSLGLQWPPMTDAQHQASANDSPGGVSDLHWTGANAVGTAAANGITGCVHSSGHILMYAPSPLGPSNVAHVDSTCVPPEVMAPAYTVATHAIALTTAMLQDMGWDVGPIPTPSPTLTPTPSPTPTLGPLDHFTCYKAAATAAPSSSPASRTRRGSRSSISS